MLCELSDDIYQVQPWAFALPGQGMYSSTLMSMKFRHTFRVHSIKMLSINPSILLKKYILLKKSNF